ncbi:MAG: nickel-dependent lactate racemase [Coleofasciculus sp. A1-SPW-01]|uniref:nickel-dependent lactate racemase n=1 Tax=Coleofasciculus sp. A1-SPW-01 TaxID=3070819 RepID=UPI0032FF6C65
MYQVPYGKTDIDFELPPEMRGTLAVSESVPPLRDVKSAIAKTLSTPINSPPLDKLAHPGDRVCIVFTDITRDSPDQVLIPPILQQLKKAGVRDQDITLLCGIGMHRPSTMAEKVTKLGQAVVDRYRVIDHEPQNPDQLVDLGVINGIPLSVNKIAYHADILIATGIVEPHQYAGYSGGCKTVAVGAAGESLIAYSHGPKFIDNPNCRLGKLEGNPFQQAVTEAAMRAGLGFIINVVLDDQKQIVSVLAGEPRETHKQLVEKAKTFNQVSIDQQYDVVIGGVGFPKDANLYQASRAASYLFFAPTPVVHPGGYLIIPAQCPEGVGEGVGEQRFLAAMRDIPSVQQILQEGRKHGYPPGQQRAFVMAKVLEQNSVIIVGSDYPEVVEACKMIPAATMDEALARVAADLGKELDVLVVPHALLTLPVISHQ